MSRFRRRSPAGFGIRLTVNLLFAAVLVAASVTPLPATVGGGVSDAWLHAVAYGVQAGLLLWLVGSLAAPLTAGCWSLAATSLLGGFTELLQGVIPARTAELRDLGADVVGALAVVGLWLAAAAVLGRRAESIGEG